MTAISVDPATRSADRATNDAEAFSLTLRLYRGYAQVVDFGPPGQTLLAIDEPPPLGRGYGPNPARVLASAVGGCLGASLLYCLRKSRIEASELSTKVEGTIVRNERGRLRIGQLRVTLLPAVPAAERERMARCLEVFEDFCVVTQSVRDGIDVDVRVEPVDPPQPTAVDDQC
jgi:organic hydroperoxide reductase OsmC/OhrA